MGGHFERMFLDVRVFNPFVHSNAQGSLAAMYRRREQEKAHRYDQRVREVEHSSFTPLVFSCSGGMGRLATAFYKESLPCLLRRDRFPTVL